MLVGPRPRAVHRRPGPGQLDRRRHRPGGRPQPAARPPWSSATQEMETIRQVGSALASSTFDMNKVLQLHHGHDPRGDERRGRVTALPGRAASSRWPWPSTAACRRLKTFRLKLGQGIAGYVGRAGRGGHRQRHRSDRLQFFPVIDEDVRVSHALGPVRSHDFAGPGDRGDRSAEQGERALRRQRPRPAAGHCGLGLHRAGKRAALQGNGGSGRA
ncbi:MAG: hypothetical protein MZV70_37635 [Desulfobacterales bacterium]|nr:hypothetical protein [Desulfobacterales bacterium]